MKKVLTVFLSIALVLAMIPGMVFATGGNAESEKEDLKTVQVGQIVLFNAERCAVGNDGIVSLSNDAEEGKTLEYYAATVTTLYPMDDFTVVIAQKNKDGTYTAIKEGVANKEASVISFEKDSERAECYRITARSLGITELSVNGNEHKIEIKVELPELGTYKSETRSYETYCTDFRYDNYANDDDRYAYIISVIPEFKTSAEDKKPNEIKCTDNSSTQLEDASDLISFVKTDEANGVNIYKLKLPETAGWNSYDIAFQYNDEEGTYTQSCCLASKGHDKINETGVLVLFDEYEVNVSNGFAEAKNSEESIADLARTTWCLDPSANTSFVIAERTAEGKYSVINSDINNSNPEIISIEKSSSEGCYYITAKALGTTELSIADNNHKIEITVEIPELGAYKSKTREYDSFCKDFNYDSGDRYAYIISVIPEFMRAKTDKKPYSIEYIYQNENGEQIKSTLDKDFEFVETDTTNFVNIYRLELSEAGGCNFYDIMIKYKGETEEEICDQYCWFSSEGHDKSKEAGALAIFHPFWTEIKDGKISILDSYKNTFSNLDEIKNTQDNAWLEISYDFFAATRANDDTYNADDTLKIKSGSEYIELTNKGGGAYNIKGVKRGQAVLENSEGKTLIFDVCFPYCGAYLTDNPSKDSDFISDIKYQQAEGKKFYVFVQLPGDEFTQPERIEYYYDNNGTETLFAEDACPIKLTYSKMTTLNEHRANLFNAEVKSGNVSYDKITIKFVYGNDDGAVMQFSCKLTAQSTNTSSGGGAVIPPAADEDNVKTTTDGTTSEIKTSTTVKDTKTETVKNEQGEEISKVTATVSEKVAEKLVDATVSNKSDTVEITVKSDDGNKVEQTEIEIPKKALESIAKDTDADLVITTDNGQVTLDNKTLETIAEEAEGDTVKITVNENTQLKEEQKPASDVIGKNGKLFDIKAVIGDRIIHDFKGGKAHVILPMPEELKGKDIVIIYINDKGICEILNHTMETVGAEEYIKFTTSHFSNFAVVEKADAEKIIDKQNADKINSLIKEAKLKATTSKTSKKNVKIKVSVKNNNSLIKEAKAMGYTVKYKFYRSTKKASKYKAVKTKTSNTYISTNGKKGTKYYYKAKVLVYDGKKLVAQTTLKQCSYGARRWSK